MMTWQINRRRLLWGLQGSLARDSSAPSPCCYDRGQTSWQKQESWVCGERDGRTIMMMRRRSSPQALDDSTEIAGIPACLFGTYRMWGHCWRWQNWFHSPCAVWMLSPSPLWWLLWFRCCRWSKARTCLSSGNSSEKVGASLYRW